jgi:ABC-2 type transport system ATP-binding protein
VTAIRVESLSHAYGGRPALGGVSFEVEAGTIFGLLGPNGGGKTTLFRVLATMLVPGAGRAFVLGHDVVRDAAAVRRAIGVVFQSPSLDGKLTVAENLRHQGRLYGMGGARLWERIGEMLRRVGLLDRARERVERLSGGLKRRVELAKGLLHGPKVLLLDEPSTGLDPGARRDLWLYLDALRREGATVLLTTHLMEEADRCDRLAILDRGRLVALGTPTALKAEIGGDVITLDAPDPEMLRESIRGRLGIEATLVAGRLRIERREGAAFVPQLLAAFPGRIASVTVGPPTLEDVFVKKTGHRFWGDAA